MKLTVLGSGTSHGIPVIACDCPVCRSADPRDMRRRSSLYVEGRAGERLLVDIGCDFRVQAIDAGLTRLDAVFLTHPHADHLHGLDDIRPLTWYGAVPVYGNKAAIADLRERFAYIFKETQRGGGKPKITTAAVDAPLAIGGVTVTPLAVKHGCLDILGYMFTEGGASVAFVTDCSELPPASFALVSRCDTFVLGALRVKEHATHLSFDQALDLSARLREAGGRLSTVYFTHISHETSHKDIERYCAAWLSRRAVPGLAVTPAFDMLVL